MGLKVAHSSLWSRSSLTDFSVVVPTRAVLLLLAPRCPGQLAQALLQSPALVRQITFLTNSSSQGNIGMGDIERLIVTLPSQREQQAIANVISDHLAARAN